MRSPLAPLPVQEPILPGTSGATLSYSENLPSTSGLTSAPEDYIPTTSGATLAYKKNIPPCLSVLTTTKVDKGLFVHSI